MDGTRGSGVVPCEAHNLVTPVQFRPPQQAKILKSLRSGLPTQTGKIERSDIRNRKYLKLGVEDDFHAGVAQRLEQNLHKVEVGSSILPAGTIEYKHAGVA